MLRSLSRVSIAGWRTPVTIQSMVSQYKDCESVFDLEKVRGQKHTNFDYFELFLLNSDSSVLSAAADKLWQFDYFSNDTMTIYSTFQAQNRRMKVGDLICEQIHIVPGFLETVVFNTVKKVIDEPNKKGFVVDSTEIHDEIGRLCCYVEHRNNGDLVLTVDATCMFLVAPFRKLARKMQLKAHSIAMCRFEDSLRAYSNAKGTNDSL